MVLGHAKVLCTLGGGHCGVVNHYGDVLEREGLPWKEEQFRFAELEVVGRPPS